jgi:hypothetical protein
VSRQRPWLPAATPIMIGGWPFEFTPEDWVAIEQVFGRPLDDTERESLAEITGEYVALRDVELNLPLADDAFALLDRVEHAAGALYDALWPLVFHDGGPARILQLFGSALRELDFAGHQNLSAIEPLESFCGFEAMLTSAGHLVRGSERVREKLTSPRPLNDIDGRLIVEVEVNAPNPMAWHKLIWSLAEFAAARDIRVSARGDYEKASPFVVLALAIEVALPERIRRGASTNEAFARAVSNALKELRVKKNGPVARSTIHDLPDGIDAEPAHPGSKFKREP